MNINDLGAGRLRPATEDEEDGKPRSKPLFPMPPSPPTSRDGLGRAGLLPHDPAGLEVPEDNQGEGPKLR